MMKYRTLALLVALSLAVGLGAQASPAHTPAPRQQVEAKTVDTPLSDTDTLKAQLAATTFERDILRIDAEAQAAKQRAQKTYQDTLTSIAGKGCTLGATAEGKAVRRCVSRSAAKPED